MNTRSGDILYGAGLVGAAISCLYSMDAIWVHSSGQSLLPISGRYLSREGMLTAISIGLVAALVCWGAGALARHLVNRSAAKQAVADRQHAAGDGELSSVARRQTEQVTPPGPGS